MKIAGIITEYNPFHRGHEYQIQYIRRELGADYIIAVMSGDYVQRGTPALFPKHLRAEMALKGGADLVLELPSAFSAASAEFFAKGGVSLLNSLGVVNLLCFGSESGEIGGLMELAELLTEEPDEYRRLLKDYLSQGLSFPAARNEAVLEYFRNPRNFCGDDFDGALLPLYNEISRLLSSPNNILGIEYCKALLHLHSPIKPVTLRREGNGYHDESVSEKKYASATAIRRLLLEGSSAAASPAKEELRRSLHALLPAETAPLVWDAFCENRMVTEADFDSVLHYCLLRETDYGRYLDVSGDLAQRIRNQRNRFEGFAQFASLLKTREVTQTRIQRALLHILLDIREVPETVPYARVLGFRKSSSPLLKEIKAHSSVPLLTRGADAASLLDEKGLALFEQDAFASNLYESALSRKTGRAFVHEYEKQVVVL